MALSKILENSITDGVVSSAKLKDFAAAVDLNGVELILDADQDTSITADTDDRIDFKIANTDHISIGTSSGDTVIKPMTDAKDIIFQQYDGNKILEINDGNYVGVGGNSAGAGEIRIYEDTDNGNHYTGFKAGNNTASVAYVLPTADGSSGHALQTDGSGTLSWGAAGTITSYTNSTNNRVITSVDSSTINSEANLTFDGSTLAVTGAVTVSTNLDVDGTANLDAVDIDGAVQLDATLTVGANDQGYDVILYGDTASANLTWDTSVDDLILNGAARIVVPDGQLVLGSTAVTSTAAELNLLDGVSGLVQADLTKLAAVDSTAAELNIVDGGTSATSTTVADADRVVMNDNGTMVQVAVTDLAAYFDDEITAMPNLTSVGTLTTLTVDDITLNGSTISDSGDFTLDIGGDIVLDADGADFIFKDAGTEFGRITNSSTDFVIQTAVSDKDFVIKGNDGGSTITPLTVDMSAAGALFLTGGLIDLKNAGSVSEIKFYCESSNAHAQSLVGAPHSESATNTLTLPGTGGDARLVSRSSTDTLTNKTLTSPDINTSIELLARAEARFQDASGGQYVALEAPATVSSSYVMTLPDADGSSGQFLRTDGSGALSFATVSTSTAFDDVTAGDAAVNVTTTAGNITIDAQGNDTDIIFKGTDGGSDTTFLTIDGSAAGSATFNSGITVGGDIMPGANHVHFADNGNAKFGGGEDLKIYHDGSNSFIKDAGTGSLEIWTNELKIKNAAGDENGIYFAQDGAVNLYHDNSLTFNTQNRGISVTGNPGDSTSEGVIEVNSSFAGNGTGVLFFKGDGTAIGRITIVGGGDSVAYYTSSDYRKKQDIADMDTVWDTIKALQPRKFKWKSNVAGGFDTGFVAHEAAAQIPSSVSGAKDATENVTNAILTASGDLHKQGISEAAWTEGKSAGIYADDSTWSASTSVKKYQQIDTNKMIPYLVKGLKEAIAKIETLETKVQALEDA